MVIVAGHFAIGSYALANEQYKEPSDSNSACNDLILSSISSNSKDSILRIFQLWVVKQTDPEKIKQFELTVVGSDEPLNPLTDPLSSTEVQMSQTLDLLIGKITRDEWKEIQQRFQQNIDQALLNIEGIQKIDDETSELLGFSLVNSIEIDTQITGNLNLISLDKNSPTLVFNSYDPDALYRIGNLIQLDPETGEVVHQAQVSNEDGSILANHRPERYHHSFDFVQPYAKLDEHRFLTSIEYSNYMLAEVDARDGQARILKNSQFEPKIEFSPEDLLIDHGFGYYATIEEKESTLVSFKKVNLTSGEITNLASLPIKSSERIVVKKGLDGNLHWFFREDNKLQIHRYDPTKNILLPPKIFDFETDTSWQPSKVYVTQSGRLLYILKIGNKLFVYEYEPYKNEVQLVDSYKSDTQFTDTFSIHETEEGHLLIAIGKNHQQEFTVALLQLNLETRKIEHITNFATGSNLSQPVEFLNVKYQDRFFMLVVQNNGTLSVQEFLPQTGQVLLINEILIDKSNSKRIPVIESDGFDNLIAVTLANNPKKIEIYRLFER